MLELHEEIESKAAQLEEQSTESFQKVKEKSKMLRDTQKEHAEKILDLRDSLAISKKVQTKSEDSILKKMQKQADFSSARLADLE